MFNGPYYLLSDCLGGSFGNKWTNVDRGRFFPNGTTKQSLSCLLSDRNPRIKKKETFKLPRATQTKKTNLLQCNQCFMRQFECVFRFECFYISERSNMYVLEDRCLSC